MNKQTVKLIAAGKEIAVAEVVEMGDQFAGRIDLGHMPKAMRAVFDEFEEVVNNQMFSFLDEVQTKIAALSIKVLLDSGFEVGIQDLQIFPNGGKVSFKVAEIPARTA